jgi:hypothetical protein
LGTGRLVLSTDHVEAGRLVGGVTRIVITAYRYKPPPRKRKLALAGPAVITRANKRGDPSKPAPAAAKPAIVTTTSRKRVKLLRAEGGQQSWTNPDHEADAAMRAWLERAKWGHGPARRQGAAAAILAEPGRRAPLPSGAEALDVPFSAFPWWFMHPRTDAAQDHMSAQN